MRKIIIGFLLLLVALPLALDWAVDRWTADRVEDFCSHVLLADISVGRADVSLLKREAVLLDVDVDAPGGGKALRLPRVEAAFDRASLVRRGPVVLREIFLEQPAVVLDHGLARGLRDLLRNASAASKLRRHLNLAGESRLRVEAVYLGAGELLASGNATLETRPRAVQPPPDRRDMRPVELLRLVLAELDRAAGLALAEEAPEPPKEKADPAQPLPEGGQSTAPDQE
jgi:hypothetical protein